MAYRGALLYLNANYSLASASFVYLSWHTVVDHDTDGFFSSGAPTRLSVPAGSGIGRVQLNFGVRFGVLAGWDRFANIDKNGGSFRGGGAMLIPGPTSASRSRLAIQSAVVPVVPGTDYFEAQVWQNSGSALAVEAHEQTYFAIRVIA